MDFVFISEHHIFRYNNCPPVYYAAYSYNAVLFIDEPFVAVRFIINLESLSDIVQKFLETANIIIENLDELQSCIDKSAAKADEDEIAFLEVATDVVPAVFPYCFDNTKIN
jgi:cobalamin biosynthesis protein CbiG